jgi:putative ATP-dependent endonuclease of the OLD family
LLDAVVCHAGFMAGPRLDALGIKGYRSIDGWVKIKLPAQDPLVLIGENNAGKSNVLRALSLIFGDFWPGSHRPEDHEYFGRSPEGNEIKIIARTSELPCDKCNHGTVIDIRWVHALDEDPQTSFTRTADGCAHTYMTNEIRQSLFCMTVGVNRDLSYQLSYSSKWTTLSKLMRRFHDRLVSDPDRVEALKRVFGSLVSTFEEVEEFQAFGDGLRQSFADFGGNLRYGLGIDFSAYDPSNYFRSLRIFPHIDGMPTTYEELGTGQEQVLAMAFAYAYADAFGGDGLLLAIEEPESHLHPLAQQWLARKLRELASRGVQVIITTHSPYFVDLSAPWATALVRKESEASGTTITQLDADDLAEELVRLGAPAKLTSHDSIGPFYDAAATYATVNGFFARACVLVEGATEELALGTLLERSGFDPLRHGIAIVPVEGLTNMAKWARLYRAYGIPVYAVFDSDSNKNDRDAAQSRDAALEVLSAIGVEGGAASHPRRLAVGDRHACFDPNFEVALRNTFSGYVDAEAAAAERVGRSKQLRARECVRGIRGPGEAPDEWVEVVALAAGIAALVPEVDSSETAAPVQPAPSGTVSRRAARR